MGLTLSKYFAAVDDGDFQVAYSTFGPSEAAKAGSEESFATGDATTRITNIDYGSPSELSPTMSFENVEFTSHQVSSHGPNGNTCDNWTLRYQMVEVRGIWLINAVTGSTGVTHTVCAGLTGSPASAAQDNNPCSNGGLWQAAADQNLPDLPASGTFSGCAISGKWALAVSQPGSDPAAFENIPAVGWKYLGAVSAEAAASNAFGFPYEVYRQLAAAGL